MSELHKFLFDGLPVRGMIVRLSDAWVEILNRRASNTSTGAYPVAVQELLGEMTAAAALMQTNIKFDGGLVLQIFGDGPVKVAVAEVQSDLRLRATATLTGEVADGATLSQMVNVNRQGRCAITLEPRTQFPGQQPYQGIVPLQDEQGAFEKISTVLEHYMLQSQQLESTIVLAANDKVAAGLLIQRMPRQGQGNLAGGQPAHDPAADDEDYNRIAILASSLQREELLTLDVDTILHRLFWEEKLLRYPPLQGQEGPRFSCNCSRERVGRMIHSLGVEEAESILSERSDVEVGCEFCGKQYRFDAVDVAQLFVAGQGQPPADAGGLVH